MPRNITVTFADGSSHVYRNAPDNLTPEAVSARAQKDFGKQVTALDGGRRGAPAQSQTPQQRQLQKFSGLDKRRAQVALTTAERAFAENLERRGISGKARDAALTQFQADPRMRALRKSAGMPEVYTRREQVRDTARRVVRERQQSGITPAWATSLKAGLTRSLFGVPERLAAAGLYYTGQGGNSYDETLDFVRDKTDAEMGLSTGGNIIGQVSGSLLGGGAVANTIRRGGGRLLASASPIAQRAGNVIQRLTTLERGQRGRNAAKIAGAGAGYGAAQAAGEGSNVLEGAGYGAAGGLALHGAAKGVIGAVRAARGTTRAATRPFSGSTGKAIRETISEDPAAVASRAAELSRRTGTNVPVAAALNDADFRAVTDRVLKRSPQAAEIAKGESGKYLRGFMDRMLGHVNQAGKQGNAQITSIGELAQLRRDTADELMAPIAGRELDITKLPLDDLERAMARQIGGRIQGLGPRINEALKDLHPDDLKNLGLDASDIANARKLLSDYGFGKSVMASVKEMDSLRRALDAAGKASVASNPANSLAFRNAAKSIRNFVSDEVPAYGQMVDTFAAQSRMMEGFETAAKGTRVADIADDTLRNNLRTPEGRVGMKAGELFRLREAATAKPTSAISLARDLSAQGRLTRPASLEPGAAQPGTVTENLGELASRNLADAANAETRVLGRMLDTDKLNALAKNEEGALSPEDIVYGAFLGNALNSTKARFLASLLDKLPHGFNKKIANNVADMLFSQDPAKTAQALRALQRVGITERAARGLMQNSLPRNVAAMIAAQDGGEAPNVVPEAAADPLEGIDTSNAPSVMDDLGETDDAPVEEAAAGEMEFDENVPYGVQVVMSVFPEAEITDAVRLPESDLGEANPGSYHVNSQNAVDLRPIPGMTFEEFIERLQAEGYEIIEAIDEVNNPSSHATGPHWHVVIAG